MSMFGSMFPAILVVLAKQTSAVAQTPKTAGNAASGVYEIFFSHEHAQPLS
jgi:hypothetical protein